MSIKIALILNRFGFSVSHDGDRGWIIIEKSKKNSPRKAAI